MLDKAAEFIKQCDPKDTTIVYHGGCGDGITAGAILLRTFQKYFGEMPKAKFASPSTLSSLSLHSKYVIFTDLPAGAEIDYVLKLSERSNVMIIDNHEITKNLNSERIVQVHPDFFETKIPKQNHTGAILTYEVCSRVINIEELDWLAAVGLIHDVSGEAWKPFLDKVFAKYRELGKVSYKYQGKIGEIVSILTASQELKGGNELALKVCLEADRPSDILEAKIPEVSELIEVYKERTKEFEHFMDSWEKLAEIDRKIGLVFYELELKHKLASAIATTLSQRNPDLLFVVMQKEKPSKLKISFRQTLSKVDCNWLAKASTAEFGGEGGGHKPAGAGSIHPKYKEKFKEKVRELVKQKLGK
ncbi:MAG TPA: DHHA1 domain-containing protein [Candidatus Nanoarchaeia archaeon]|nr:DHHA1 domain-containing protein [Candidatus Nanoarchaeia archaeon]